MKITSPKNPNYAATVVVVDKLVPLSNCDNVQGAVIYGNHVIVGKDTALGDIGIYFPLECALSKEFLGENNLYRKAEFGNKDAGAKGGFFEAHGRVKALKFRGHKSEGFFCPLSFLNYLGHDSSEYTPGMTFDAIDEREVCRKYVVRTSTPRSGGKQGKKASVKDAIVDGQFHFHIDTEQLRRNIHKINPENYISISDKWHGTSAVYANILVKRELPWYERLARTVGIRVQEAEYQGVWASRRVVKGVAGEARKDAVHFYGADIWGIVGKEVLPLLPKGITVYGEIVGWMPDGGAIQKGYHYGCPQGTHKFLVYRVTFTNADGKVYEFSWPACKEFCAAQGLDMVKEIWYGKASEFVGTEGLTDIEFHACLLFKMEHEYACDEMCEYNNREVPAEGIVVRVDRLESCEAYKLKNFAFLKRETELLDKGEEDIEESGASEEV